MNVLSLFSGVGGLDLGLERAGMTVVGQVELDPFCQRVLAKHWPEVPRHDDVRTTVAWWLGEPRPSVDVVAGGFPCQPVSSAGKQLAQDDERWLWPQTLVVVRELRPSWALLENVPGLLARGFGDVLGDLAEIGYDAEWDCVPAAALGAPHIRDRVFVLAHPSGIGRPAGRKDAGEQEVAEPVNRGVLPDTTRVGRNVGSIQRPTTRHARRWPEPRRRGWWAAEPVVGRVAYGVPARVDRLRSLGNAVVPQVAEHVGRLITEGAA